MVLQFILFYEYIFTSITHELCVCCHGYTHMVLYVLGSMRELDVIDVSRQDDMRMKMREWTEYYEENRSRSKVLNVISLEFTGTE